MTDDKFSKEETDRRFAAALRGARIAGPRHVESVTPKQGNPQQKKKKDPQKRGKSHAG
jgi:hypothetical protein